MGRDRLGNFTSHCNYNELNPAINSISYMESVSVSISSWFSVDGQYEIRVRIIEIWIAIGTTYNKLTTNRKG